MRINREALASPNTVLLLRVVLRVLGKKNVPDGTFKCSNGGADGTRTRDLRRDRPAL